MTQFEESETVLEMLPNKSYLQNVFEDKYFSLLQFFRNTRLLNLPFTVVYGLFILQTDRLRHENITK